MVIYSPDEISVTQGNRFSITCSTHSKYPGGVFYLKKSEMNTTDMKPTFGHSVFYLAYFEFLAIDFKDQGEYSCVYAVNLSSIYFSSVPSRSIHVTVVGKTVRKITYLCCHSEYSSFAFLLLSFISTATSSSSVITGIVVSLVVLLIVLVVCYLVWRRRWRGIGKWQTVVYYKTTVMPPLFNVTPCVNNVSSCTNLYFVNNNREKILFLFV